MRDGMDAGPGGISMPSSVDMISAQPVQNFVFGGVANPVQRPFLRASDRDYLQERQAELDEFEKQRMSYNTALQEWQTGVYNPYVEEVNAFNAAAQRYNTDVYDPYMSQVAAYNDALARYNREVYEPYSTQYSAYEQAINAWNQGPRTTDYSGPSAPALPRTFDMGMPSQPASFGMQAPSTPEDFSMAAPQFPFDEAEVERYQQDAAKRAQKDAGGRALAIDVVSDPDRFNFGSMSVANRFMAEGGAVQEDKGSARSMLDEVSSPEEDVALQRMLREVRDNGKMSEDQVRQAVEKIAAAGRGGDELLAHLSPESMALLKRMGGSGTINPVTGLPEFFLRKAFRRLLSQIKKAFGGKAAAPAPPPAAASPPAPEAAAPAPEAPKQPTAAELMQQLEAANAANAAAQARYQADLAAQQEAARAAQEKAVAEALRADAEARAKMVSQPVMGEAQVPAPAQAPAPAPQVQDRVAVSGPQVQDRVAVSGPAGGAASSLSAVASPASTFNPVAAANPLSPINLDASVGRISGLERPQMSGTAGMTGAGNLASTPMQRQSAPEQQRASAINITGPALPGIGAYGPVGQMGTAREQLSAVSPKSYFAQGAQPGMMPGTLAAPYDPMAMYQGPSPSQAIFSNPGSAPGMLGGEQNAGVMYDRLGNAIYSPGMPRFGFAKGGSADVAAMRALVDASNAEDEDDDEPSVGDYASEAKKMLDATGVSRPNKTPFARSKERVSAVRLPKGEGGQTAKGMALEYESLTEAKDFKPKATGKTAKAQLRSLARQYQLKQRAAENESLGLMRNTLGAPTLEKPTLLDEGLMARRFQEGGAVKKDEVPAEEEDRSAPESESASMLTRLGRGAAQPLVSAYELYQRNIGQPFANVAGPMARGYLGFDMPGYGSDEVYRTGQALGNMPGVGGPAGVVKAATQAPEMLKAFEAAAVLGAGAGARKGLGREAASIYTPLPSAEAPFVGRLDQFVSTLPGPVRKDQFLGQLQGKFRDYEIGRAREALAELDDSAKITPSDLLNKLRANYDPARYRTQVIEPEPDSFFHTVDNVYQGKPLGVIHMIQDALPESADITKKSRDVLQGMYSSSYGTIGKEASELLETYNGARKALEELPGVPRKTLRDFRRAFVPYARANKEKLEFTDLSDMVKYPELSTAFKERMGKALNDRTPESRTHAFRLSLRDEIRNEGAQQIARKYSLPDFPELLKSPEGIAQSDAKLNQVRDRLTEKIRDTGTGLRDSLSSVYVSSRPYQGQHTSLRNASDPIAFSRFSEHTTDVPGMGFVKGIYVNELQSDRLQDIRNMGPVGGNQAKDFSKLEPNLAKRQELVRELVDLKMSGKSPERVKQVESLLKGVDNRDRQLYKRITEGTYSLKESFPGMEESPQVIQQLMAKNVISAAMRRGDSFVAFPGAESKQAQLYENLPNNLKQVIKDLGPGFEYRSIVLRDASGKEYMHPAVVWSKEGATRPMITGVPFKDGGAVSKNAAFIKAHG